MLPLSANYKQRPDWISFCRTSGQRGGRRLLRDFWEAAPVQTWTLTLLLLCGCWSWSLHVALRFLSRPGESRETKETRVIESFGAARSQEVLSGFCANFLRTRDVILKSGRLQINTNIWNNIKSNTKKEISAVVCLLLCSEAKRGKKKTHFKSSTVTSLSKKGSRYWR